MKRLLIDQLSTALNQRVCLRGWFNNIRPFGKINFLIVRDRTGFAQVLIEDKEEFKKLQGLHPGTVLTVEGMVVASRCEFGVEINSPTLTVEVPVTEAPPLEYYKPELSCDLETILDHRPIALRHRKEQAVFKIQGEIAHAYRLYMHDVIKASEYFAPNLIGTSSEGGAEFFMVDYFGYPATLAQSSQLYKQIMVGVNERVFALMPFFRAEPSHTTRHLSEGKQFEFEIGFFNHWHEILDIQEGCIKFIVEHLKEYAKKELEILGNPLITAPKEIPFPRLTFKEAQEIAFQLTRVDERAEPDLSPAAERALCQYALTTYGTQLLFITDWKVEKRPFYSFVNEEDPTLTNTFDLLCAGTEITSGGQRRHTYESMVEGIRLKGLDPKDFSDYLSIFKYGMPPHGGFGMGLERLTMTLLQLKNVREVSLFPSDTKRIAAVRLKAKIFFGGENIRNEIIRLLKAQDLPFEHLLHEATSVDSKGAAQERNVPLNEGAKALLLRGKQSKKNYMAVILAHCKLDTKAFAQLVGEKCEFESPEVIEQRFGLQVGAVPPFGNLLNLDTFFDQAFATQEQVHFNCGLRTESIQMRAKDLLQLAQATLSSIV